MTYNFNIPFDCISAQKRLDFLIAKKAKAEITEKKNKRTIDQNALLWLWLTCIENETGTDKDDLHEYFKGKFLGFKQNVFNGESYDVRLTTKKLNTAEFTEYLNKINQFASTELGIYLPNPKDLGFESFYEAYINRV